MGGGHAVFFAEVVGFVAPEGKLQLRVVALRFDFVPLLRLDHPFAALGREQVFGNGAAVFIQAVKLQAACRDLQPPPRAFLGVVLRQKASRNVGAAPNGHFFVANQIVVHGVVLCVESVNRFSGCLKTAKRPILACQSNSSLSFCKKASRSARTAPLSAAALSAQPGSARWLQLWKRHCPARWRRSGKYCSSSVRSR